MVFKEFKGAKKKMNVLFHGLHTSWKVTSLKSYIFEKSLNLKKIARFYHRGRSMGAGGAHPSPWDEAFFVFSFKICYLTSQLPHSFVVHPG